MALGFCLLLWTGSSLLLAASPADPVAVAEVRAGRRTEARAAWWGFDPSDSTGALQAAINSGARKLIVEKMSAPWVTDRIILATDQEIVFEDGVIVQAKRGAFKGRSDCLFSAVLKKNITLSGKGATLKMWKQDYDDAAQYQRAEWRHVLGFWSCSGVRVSGLVLADSGGDGIYLGVARKGVPCSDVSITGVTCANNYRQGVSVISARDLLIEDCVFRDTWGTAPEAGIDFEPNDSAEELANCVMRNCVSENNRGDAMAFYLRPLRGDSKPLSLRIENCRTVGGRHSVSVTTANDAESAGVKGTLEFIGCRFTGSQDAAVVIGDKPLSGARIAFSKCEIIEPAAKRPETSPIQFTSRADGAATMGGVRFDACEIRDTHDRRPMSCRDMSGGVGLAEITGALTVRRAGASVTHTLTPALVAGWMPFRAFKPVARFEMKGFEGSVW